MKIQLQNIKYKNILLFDIEYDQSSLVQIAFLILGVVEPNIFELRQSMNIYVKQNHSLSSFFTRYTNITNDFLCDNGVDLAVAKTLVDEVIFNLHLEDTLVVSHGVKNDLDILLKNDIDLKKIPNHYCTYNAAKRLLGRDHNLTLKDIAAEDCYFMFDEHNAYADVWGTLFAFSYLNGLENIKGRKRVPSKQ